MRRMISPAMAMDCTVLSPSFSTMMNSPGTPRTGQIGASDAAFGEHRVAAAPPVVMRRGANFDCTIRARDLTGRARPERAAPIFRGTQHQITSAGLGLLPRALPLYAHRYDGDDQQQDDHGQDAIAYHKYLFHVALFLLFRERGIYWRTDVDPGNQYQCRQPLVEGCAARGRRRGSQTSDGRCMPNSCTSEEALAQPLRG